MAVAVSRSLNLLLRPSLTTNSFIKFSPLVVCRAAEFTNVDRCNNLTSQRCNLNVHHLVSVQKFHLSAGSFAGKEPSNEQAPRQNEKENVLAQTEGSEKLSIFQRFKKMYKEYWYVLIPVHVVTSIGWFGTFYFSVKSGLDVVALLESLGVSEKIIDPLRGSSAGYIALAYAMYKVATPARYAVTLGGTTISINYLTKWGYIKPVPSAQQLKMIYQDKKEKYKDKYVSQREEFRKKLRQHKAELRGKMQSRKRVAKK